MRLLPRLGRLGVLTTALTVGVLYVASPAMAGVIVTPGTAPQGAGANLTFRVPGTGRRAVVRGFGAVYTGVDRRETAAFTYFDADGHRLGTYAVPVGRRKLSFLGVVFDEPVVGRVRIVYGNRALGPDEGPGVDVAVMDDFIYGEPVAP